MGSRQEGSGAWRIDRLEAVAGDNPGDMQRHRLARRDAALEAALEQLRTPAFVLSPTGEVQETNRLARARLLENRSAVLAALRAAYLGYAAELSFEITPLRSNGLSVGYLAVERQTPERMMALKELKVSQAALRWALTQRQAQVLSLVADGATNARIGATLGISERTAEDHVAAILIRANVASRAELMAVLLQ